MYHTLDMSCMVDAAAYCLGLHAPFVREMQCTDCAAIITHFHLLILTSCIIFICCNTMGPALSLLTWGLGKGASKT